MIEFVCPHCNKMIKIPEHHPWKTKYKGNLDEYHMSEMHAVDFSGNGAMPAMRKRRRAPPRRSEARQPIKSDGHSQTGPASRGCVGCLLIFVFLFVGGKAIQVLLENQEQKRYEAMTPDQKQEYRESKAREARLVSDRLRKYERKEKAQRKIESADTSGREFAWMEKGKEAVRAKLKDASSAEFRNVFFHRGKDGIPLTCGEVNSKNSFGAKSGYQRFITGGPTGPTFLEEEVVRGDFDPAWQRLCIDE